MVDEIILYYDARLKKHKKNRSFLLNWRKLPPELSPSYMRHIQKKAHSHNDCRQCLEPGKFYVALCSVENVSKEITWAYKNFVNFINKLMRSKEFRYLIATSLMFLNHNSNDYTRFLKSITTQMRYWISVSQLIDPVSQMSLRECKAVPNNRLIPSAR